MFGRSRTGTCERLLWFSCFDKWQDGRSRVFPRKIEFVFVLLFVVDSKVKNDSELADSTLYTSKRGRMRKTREVSHLQCKLSNRIETITVTLEGFEFEPFRKKQMLPRERDLLRILLRCLKYPPVNHGP